jgi:hypothetical protein
MGSTSKRKKNDTLIIRRPIRATGGGNGSGSVGQEEDDNLNKICIASFDTKLDQNLTLKNKSQITISNDDILLGNIVVGKLSLSQRKMIELCSKHGIVYRGIVMTDKELKFYGRFFRTE